MTVTDDVWLIPTQKRRPKEVVMTKTLVAIAAAFLAVTTLCSAAEAGFKVRIGFGFPLGGFNAHHGGGYAHRHHRRHRYVVRRAKKKVHVAKAKTYAPKKVAAKKVAPKQIAKAEPAVIATPEPIVKTETENSSITPVEAVTETSSTEKTAETTAETADVTADAATPVADDPKTVNKLDCKKFFPSVGMTLSVPCE
jgi:hypothetical protein